VGTVEGLCFDRGFLGDGGRLLQCLPHAYLEVLEDLPHAYLEVLRGVWTLCASKYAIEKLKTNGKALEDSIQTDWTL